MVVYLVKAAFTKLFQNAFLAKVSINDYIKLGEAEAVWRPDVVVNEG